jgi:hypothetical protein
VIAHLGELAACALAGRLLLLDVDRRKNDLVVERVFYARDAWIFSRSQVRASGLLDLDLDLDFFYNLATFLSFPREGVHAVLEAYQLRSQSYVGVQELGA